MRKLKATGGTGGWVGEGQGSAGPSGPVYSGPHPGLGSQSGSSTTKPGGWAGARVKEARETGHKGFAPLPKGPRVAGSSSVVQVRANITNPPGESQPLPGAPGHVSVLYSITARSPREVVSFTVPAFWIRKGVLRSPPSLESHNMEVVARGWEEAGLPASKTSTLSCP